jgi:hypothetical protein
MADTTPTPPERKYFGVTGGDVLKIIIGAAVVLIVGKLAQFTLEQILYVAFAGLFIVGLVLIHRNRKVTVQATITGPDAKPYEYAKKRNRWFTCVGVSLCVGAFLAVALLYWLSPQVLPLARITNFQQSDISYRYGDKFKGRHIVPKDFWPPNEEESILATPCVLVTVSIGHFTTKPVRIEALEFQVKPIRFQCWSRRLGVYPTNALMANRFTATLAPNSSRVKARMLDENGNPDEGSVILDDKNPFALLHVEFDGVTGLYWVVPILTVSDGFGRNRTYVTYESDGIWPAIGILTFPDAEKLRCQ